MNIADLPDDSDTSDEDYIPGGKPEEAVSEVESDGDPEDPLSDTEDIGKRTTKRKKKTAKSRKKIKNYSNVSGDSKDVHISTEESEEEKKKRADTLWADFMKDTGFRSRTTKQSNEINSLKSKCSNISERQSGNTNQKVQEKVTIKKVFEFAGEEVIVEKEVPADAPEARLLQKPSNSDTAKGVKGACRASGGLKSVLNQLGKKTKISTLEKSKIDWERYKREEKIEDELAAHNKGKDGYLERQDFLQRADLRRFEIEKEIRTIERNKRMDNVL